MGSLARVRLVLLKEWDPIGVRDIEEAADEYDAYADQVFSLLLRNCQASELADYLHQIATEHIGLPNFPRENSERVAARLKSLSEP